MFCNKPRFCLIAAEGSLILLPNVRGINRLRFDWPGFTVLSTRIGALRLFPGGGQDLDRCYLREVVVEAVPEPMG